MIYYIIDDNVLSFMKSFVNVASNPCADIPFCLDESIPPRTNVA